MPGLTIVNNDSGKLPVFNPIFDDIEVEAAGALDLDAGTVLAFNATTGTWWETKSGTAAVANAKAVLASDISFAGAGTIENVRSLIGGEVDESKLLFNGADTIDTIPAGAADSFRVQLRSYGIIARPGQVEDVLDNQ